MIKPIGLIAMEVQHLGIGAISKFKAHKENPTQIRLGKGGALVSNYTLILFRHQLSRWLDGFA
jgi:hypothetical protein